MTLAIRSAISCILLTFSLTLIAANSSLHFSVTALLQLVLQERLPPQLLEHRKQRAAHKRRDVPAPAPAPVNESPEEQSSCSGSRCWAREEHAGSRARRHTDSSIHGAPVSQALQGRHHFSSKAHCSQPRPCYSTSVATVPTSALLLSPTLTAANSSPLHFSSPYFRRDYPQLLELCKQRAAQKRRDMAAPVPALQEAE